MMAADQKEMHLNSGYKTIQDFKKKCIESPCKLLKRKQRLKIKRQEQEPELQNLMLSASASPFDRRQVIKRAAAGHLWK
jgi:hypothetical protein